MTILATLSRSASVNWNWERDTDGESPDDSCQSPIIVAQWASDRYGRAATKDQLAVDEPLKAVLQFVVAQGRHGGEELVIR